MISPFSSSVSGINAAFRMLDVSANNTANMNTDGFKKDSLSLREDENGGVVVSISKTGSPGPKYENYKGNTVEASNADYAEEAAILITAKHYLKANIAAFKTADEMQKSVIDILG